MRETTVVIPAYMPDEKMIALLEELLGDFPVLVIDDGSGECCQPYFDRAEQLGAIVLRHEKNKGKGAALKTAYRYLSENGKGGCVTADADGQHTKKDITAVADELETHENTLIIGGRDFSEMPLRSKFGNTITRFVFRMATRTKISDTQTGLRGIPGDSYDKMLAVEGDRYEYEINVLLSLRKWDMHYKEIPIETVYIDNNSSSHFHPIADGLKVFGQVLKFAMSSLVCTGVDYVLYIVLKIWLPLDISYAIARAVSALLNYQLSRRVVFKGQPSIWSFIGYFALAACVMLVGANGVEWLSKQMGWNSIVAKMVLDSGLFVLNYFMQKKVIFRNRVED